MPRSSYRPLRAGQQSTIYTHGAPLVIERASPAASGTLSAETFTFTPRPGAAPVLVPSVVADINACLRGSGLSVSRYWRTGEYVLKGVSHVQGQYGRVPKSGLPVTDTTATWAYLNPLAVTVAAAAGTPPPAPPTPTPSGAAVAAPGTVTVANPQGTCLQCRHGLVFHGETIGCVVYDNPTGAYCACSGTYPIMDVDAILTAERNLPGQPSGAIPAGIAASKLTPSVPPMFTVDEEPEPDPLTDVPGDEWHAPEVAMAEGQSHRYRPSREVVETWQAVRAAAEATGAHPEPLMFLGPSGCGKTDCARYLAALSGLPYTKVDCAAMVDAESWFGTREVTEQDGASVTVYRPSAFVEALQRPGVLLLDEVNRVSDAVRNILLPLTDGTHTVTNPLTGEPVTRHPECYLIMSGNRGLAFTGTYAMDPALMSRSDVLLFDYLSEQDEAAVAVEATGVDPETARLFARFARETRNRAAADDDAVPVSTREVIKASLRVRYGLSRDTAIRVVAINAASPEGGDRSQSFALSALWAAVAGEAARS